MKTFILLFNLIFIHNLCIGQNWAPIGAKWHIGLIESFFSPNQGYIIVESIGDTVISGKNCQILSQTRYYSNGNISNLGSLYMYEDSGKVFNYFVNDFYTLYDFNAQPGDTWSVVVPYPSPFSQGPNPPDSIVTIVVDSISTTMISGQNLKTLYVHSDSNDWYFLNPIIENIGSRSGLFPYIYDWMDSDLPFLRCYEDATLNFQQNPTVDCDLLITSTIDVHDQKSLTLSPIPFKEHLIIHNGYNEDFAVEVIDMNGKIVNRFSQSRTSQLEINMMFLQKGFYVFRFTSTATLQKYKFLVPKL
jgi:hypothetical protein